MEARGADAGGQALWRAEAGGKGTVAAARAVLLPLRFRRRVQSFQARGTHGMARVRRRDHEGREVDERDVAGGEVPGRDEPSAERAAVGDGDVEMASRRWRHVLLCVFLGSNCGVFLCFVIEEQRGDRHEAARASFGAPKRC